MARKKKRCFHFDENGKPRNPTRPCYKTARDCLHAHPDDPEWGTAAIVDPPWGTDPVRYGNPVPATAPSKPSPPPPSEAPPAPSSPANSLDAPFTLSRSTPNMISRVPPPPSETLRTQDPRRKALPQVMTGFASSASPTSAPPSATFSTFKSPAIPPSPAAVAQPSSAISRHPPSKPLPPDIDPQKLEMWKQRTDLIAAYILANMRLAELAKEEQDLQTLAALISRSSTPPNIVRDFERKLAEHKQAQARANEDKLNAAYALAGTNSWPESGPASKSSAEVTERSNQLEQLVRELEGSLEVLSRVTKEIEDKKRKDEEDAANRSSKKRMLIHSDTVSPNMTDIKNLHTKIESLCDQVLEVQSELDQRQQSHHSDLLAFLDERERKMKGAGVTDELKKKVEVIATRAASVDESVKETSEVVAKLAEDAQAIKEAAVLERQEIRRIQEEVSTTFSRLEEFERAAERDKKEIDVLKAAVEAYKQNPSQSQTPRYDEAQLLELLDQQITAAVKELAYVRLADLRQFIEQKIASKDAEMYDTVWGKLSATLSLLDALMKRVGLSPEQVK